jgi:hypothetical protein
MCSSTSTSERSRVTRGAHAVVGRVGDVERPVARSTVGLVERVARGVHHGAVGGSRVGPRTAPVPRDRHPSTPAPSPWRPDCTNRRRHPRTPRTGHGGSVVDSGARGVRCREPDPARSRARRAAPRPWRPRRPRPPTWVWHRCLRRGTASRGGGNPASGCPRRRRHGPRRPARTRPAVPRPRCGGCRFHRGPTGPSSTTAYGAPSRCGPPTRRSTTYPAVSWRSTRRRVRWRRTGGPCSGEVHQAYSPESLHPGGGADPKSVTGHLGPRRFTVSEPRLAAPFVVLDVHRPTIGRLEVDDVQFAVGVGGA